MSRFLLASVVLLVACKSKAECKAEVDDLVTYLRAANRGPSPFQRQKGLDLVERPELAHATAREAPIVMLSKLETTFAGAVVDPATLAERLTAEAAKIRNGIETGRYPMRSLPDPSVVYMMIDRDVTWDRIVKVAEAAARAGFTHPGLVFAQPVTVPPPPRTWVDDKLDVLLEGSDRANAASELAQLMTGIIKDCPALQKVFAQVGSEEGDKGAIVIEGINEALPECRCDVDMPALRSIMGRVVGDTYPTAVVTMELARDGKPVELAAKTPWRAAYKQLPAGGKLSLVTR